MCRASLGFFLWVVALASAQTDPICEVQTIAGSPTSDAGDGGPAVAAQLSNASALAIDAAGNLYVADTYNHKIRLITRDGKISTVAGSGTQGFDGDGGLAIQAKLNAPAGVAVDAAGNLYIADTRNHRIRRVSAAGLIETVAGTGVSAFNGDGTALETQLSFPSYVAVDGSGSVYISDSGNFRIRKLSSTGSLVTVAGNGNLPQSIGPDGEGGPATNASLLYGAPLALDTAGNLYLKDGNYRIRVVDSAGVIRTIAGAGNGSFFDPRPGDSALESNIGPIGGIAMDAAGTLYYTDQHTRRVGAFGADGKFVGVLDAGGLALRYLAVSSDGLVGGDAEQIVRLSADNTAQRIAGAPQGVSAGDGGSATEAKLATPQGLALDGSGNLFVGESAGARIRRITPNGLITTWAGTGSQGQDGDGGPATAARLANPVDLSLDGSGNLLVADQVRIRRISPEGTIDAIPVKGAQLQAPFRISSDLAGNILLTQAVRTGFTVLSPPDNIADVRPLTVFNFAVRPDVLFRGRAGSVIALAAGALLDFSLLSSTLGS